MKKIEMFWSLKRLRGQSKLDKEPGRSMVEMLGVLAIIGVLSIGGIAGYTMAMNRYKANQILDLASKLSVMAQTAIASDPENWRDNIGDMYNELGLDTYSSWSGGTSAYEVTFSVSDDGSVWGGSHDEGIHKAIQSVTGNDAYGSEAGPLIEVN